MERKRKAGNISIKKEETKSRTEKGGLIELEVRHKEGTCDCI